MSHLHWFPKKRKRPQGRRGLLEKGWHELSCGILVPYCRSRRSNPGRRNHLYRYHGTETRGSGAAEERGAVAVRVREFGHRGGAYRSQRTLPGGESRLRENVGLHRRGTPQAHFSADHRRGLSRRQLGVGQRAVKGKATTVSDRETISTPRWHPAVGQQQRFIGSGYGKHAAIYHGAFRGHHGAETGGGGAPKK